jgi:hypothetical protein
LKEYTETSVQQVVAPSLNRIENSAAGFARLAEWLALVVETSADGVVIGLAQWPVGSDRTVISKSRITPPVESEAGNQRSGETKCCEWLESFSLVGSVLINATGAGDQGDDAAFRRVRSGAAAVEALAFSPALERGIEKERERR